MTVAPTSILSKKFKSTAWKARKAQRHEDNVKQRADLHRQKSSSSSMTGADVIQRQIDMMSSRS